MNERQAKANRNRRKPCGGTFVRCTDNDKQENKGENNFDRKRCFHPIGSTAKASHAVC